MFDLLKLSYFYSPIEYSKILVALIMLGYTSFLDLKYREVEPKIWLYFGVVLGGLTCFQVYNAALHLQFEEVISLLGYIVLSIGLASILAFSFAYLELIGGADFFAILVLSIAHPWTPTNPLLRVVSLFPLSLLANSTFLALTPMLYNLVYNVAFRGWRFWKGLEMPVYKRLMLMLVGRPMRASNFLKTKFTYLIEEVDCGGYGKREVKLSFRVSEEPYRDREKVKKALKRGLLKPSDYLWTTEGLPMLAFIFVGYLLTIIVGDFVLYMVLIALSSTGIIKF